MKKFYLFIVTFVFLIGITGAARAKEINIVYADKMKILFEYEKTKKLNEDLEEESRQAKEKVAAMSEEIRKLNDEMELLSESAKKEKAPLLESKIKELNDFRRTKMQEIGHKQDEGIRKITEEIAELCKNIGKKKGYDAIIDVRATLYSPDARDVTDEILRELNK